MCISDNAILNPTVKFGVATGPIIDRIRNTTLVNVKILTGFFDIFEIVHKNKPAAMPGNIELITTGTKLSGAPVGNKISLLTMPAVLEIRNIITFIAAAINPAIIPDFNKF